MGDGKKGTISDLDGKFTFIMSSGTTLLFTYIGFQNLSITLHQVNLILE
jgi:hypothetical protein